MQTFPTPHAGHNPSQQTPHVRTDTHLWSRGPRQTWGARFPFPSCQGILAIPLLALRARKNRPRLTPSLRFHLANCWLRDSGPRMDFVTVPLTLSWLPASPGTPVLRAPAGWPRTRPILLQLQALPGLHPALTPSAAVLIPHPHTSSLTPLWVVFSPLLKPS